MAKTLPFVALVACASGLVRASDVSSSQEVAPATSLEDLALEEGTPK